MRRPYFNIKMNTPVTIPLDFSPPMSTANSGEYTAASENESEEEETVSPDEQNMDSQTMELQKQPDKYSGYDTSSSVTSRPYTGKAQVSSFIDNGQFINAKNGGPFYSLRRHSLPPNDWPSSDHLSRRILEEDGKTVSLGYRTKIMGIKSKDEASQHNRHPDSMPWGLNDQQMHNYYSSFSFTDGLDPSQYYSIQDKSPLLQKILAWG